MLLAIFLSILILVMWIAVCYRSARITGAESSRPGTPAVVYTHRLPEMDLIGRKQANVCKETTPEHQEDHPESYLQEDLRISSEETLSLIHI